MIKLDVNLMNERARCGAAFRGAHFAVSVVLKKKNNWLYSFMCAVVDERSPLFLPRRFGSVCVERRCAGEGRKSVPAALVEKQAGGQLIVTHTHRR